jgi:glutaconate CoA-transferase subunit A
LKGKPVARILPLEQAVAENLKDGDTAAFEGFTHLIPAAAAHEAIRQGFRDLTLIRMTPDFI